MSMLTEINIGSYTLRGASLGGLYTALHIPELDSLFDVGLAIRRGATASRLFLSHAHLDHIGALPSLLGMRGMVAGSDHPPLQIYCPLGVEEELEAALHSLSLLHRWPLRVSMHSMAVGEILHLKNRLWVKALKTFHPVPSLGYLIFERIQKLRLEYQSLRGDELRELKRSNVEISHTVERPKVAYLTDTLPDALKYCPEVFEAEVLIIECTFLSEKKGVEVARAGCHIHIEELLEWAPLMKNKAVVLMHFSQVHSPQEIEEICRKRLGPILGERLHLLLPPKGTKQWWI